MLFRIGIAAAIVIGVFARLDAISTPAYWYDEAITSLRVSGHTEKEVEAFALRGTTSFGDLARFRTIAPGSGMADTIRSLTTEDAQHPPLYYVLARIWGSLVGQSVIRERLLAELFGLLAIAAIYWLALEMFVRTGMFATKHVCWIAVAVYALSPYQVGYAREHREYSLWSLMTIVVCALFWRALRKGDGKAWAAYALAVTISIYTHLFGVLTIAGLGLFLLVTASYRRHFPRYLAASAAAGVLCLPWAQVLWESRKVAQSSMGWASAYGSGKYNFTFSITPFMRSVDLAVLGVNEVLPPPLSLVHMLVFPALLGLLAWLALGERRRLVWFVLALGLCASGPILAADFLIGSTLGWVMRYVGPSQLGWSLALALIIASFEPLVAKAASLAVLAVAAVMVVMIHLQPKPFTKSFFDAESIAYINDSQDTTIVSDEFIGPVLALSEYLRPDIRLTWRPRCFSCALAIDPPIAIPAAAAPKMLYYRTWDNMTPETEVRALADQRYEDPLYRIKPAPLLTPTYRLFELTLK